ncbi:hypothetical protein [Leucobacter massiliensis]|uniref:Glutaminase n=1 Tax=Leucobacter massiliensis TaxID=1686285 RepID=A0A2S9QPT1_9MICO|nr:hypothetical protein [Leucobacter massiliensis]PRI11594.1 hypothetical protein B4915_05615 [Leucobacter massiliensis]
MAEDRSAAALRAREACAAAAGRLRGAGIGTEALARYVAPRRVLLWTKPATMEPLGEVWRVGTLLLGAEGELYALGHATRAAERGRPGYQSLSREERREIAAAALRGGYPAGTPVNYDAVRIPLGEAGTAEDRGPDPAPELPVGYAEGEFRVRWRRGAPLSGAPSLAAFLSERVDLLIHPPFAAD